MTASARLFPSSTGGVGYFFLVAFASFFAIFSHSFAPFRYDTRVEGEGKPGKGHGRFYLQVQY